MDLSPAHFHPGYRHVHIKYGGTAYSSSSIIVNLILLQTGRQVFKMKGSDEQLSEAMHQ